MAVIIGFRAIILHTLGLRFSAYGLGLRAVQEGRVGSGRASGLPPCKAECLGL